MKSVKHKLSNKNSFSLLCIRHSLPLCCSWSKILWKITEQPIRWLQGVNIIITLVVVVLLMMMMILKLRSVQKINKLCTVCIVNHILCCSLWQIILYTSYFWDLIASSVPVDHKQMHDNCANVTSDTNSSVKVMQGIQWTVLITTLPSVYPVA
jgi:glucan phosphoethanolaminetransferase (alkaline phosphatase superfamily)